MGIIGGPRRGDSGEAGERILAGGDCGLRRPGQVRGFRAAEPDTVLPGGESLTAFARRAIDAAELVEDIAAGAQQQQQQLVVAHVLLIGAVAAHTTGIREPAAVFAAATRFTLPPAGCWQHRTVVPRKTS